MQIPKTPSTFEELDLIQQLKEYSRSDIEVDKLFTNITSFVKDMLIPLLGKINAREMETFTMHDPNHALKVSHLMWYIIKPERRNKLTPPEIALLVVSAFLHDLGMALSRQEREERLGPDSDLWHRLELDESLKEDVERLKEEVGNDDTPDVIRDRARHKLYQAEEALLCQDTRERHASRERYEQVLTQLQQSHDQAPSKLPDVESCLSFAGDSFREKLIEICVSHGQDLDFLLDKDETNIERPRFPMDYTLGSCTADLHMVAAALRLADILDFDRERTPPVLFYYLLPTNLAPQDDKSILEWSKHLIISNWHIEEDAIVFRGHCSSHIIHHAVVHFCSDIEKEIKLTRDTFSIRNTDYPFNLPKSVQTKIEQHGYTYVPYKFELDDNRVYQLLMGGAIYENPLVGVRELVQNAVDACKLKDALTRMYEPQTTPNTTNRITIRYEEPTEQYPQSKLTITDTGTGMDKWILEKYFLKVGMSYYNSSDFNKIRLQLRTKNEELDFAPISEFGIGFLSCFLLADRLQVETAMWDSIRGDTLKRTLIIDGPTRLIRMSEQKNEGLCRFKGTSVTLYLSHTSGRRLRFNWMSQSDRKYPLPNLSRDKPTNSQLCAEHVCRLWLDYLLQHIDNLPYGLLYELRFDSRFWIWSFPSIFYRHQRINFSWLERYDALTIYRLAKQGWCVTLGDKGQKKIQAWENGTCDSLYLGDDTDDVYFSLLALVLPKIINFQIDGHISTRYYVKPPQSGWQASLEGWHNYVTSPVEWDPFIEYIDKIADFLYYNPTHSTFLNIRYKDRLLKCFQEHEFDLLARLFYKLSESRHIDRQAKLTNTESKLFQRAHKHLGDLKISSVTKSWRIDSFAVPKVVNSQ